MRSSSRALRQLADVVAGLEGRVRELEYNMAELDERKLDARVRRPERSARVDRAMDAATEAPPEAEPEAEPEDVVVVTADE